MTIVNWNVGRPQGNKISGILNKLEGINADILVLTETDTAIDPGKDYFHAGSHILPENFEGINYRKTENRASIWSRFPIVNSHTTGDDFTSVCVDIAAPLGLLTVYATIIGVLGGKGQRFKDDLQYHVRDCSRFSANNNFCLIGDYNTIFTGYPYPGYEARNALNQLISDSGLVNTTAMIPDCVDHIAISTGFVANKHIEVKTWNADKKLSDHIGVAVVLSDKV